MSCWTPKRTITTESIKCNHKTNQKMLSVAAAMQNTSPHKSHSILTGHVPERPIRRILDNKDTVRMFAASKGHESNQMGKDFVVLLCLCGHGKLASGHDSVCTSCQTRIGSTIRTGPKTVGNKRKLFCLYITNVLLDNSVGFRVIVNGRHLPSTIQEFTGNNTTSWQSRSVSTLEKEIIKFLHIVVTYQQILRETVNFDQHKVQCPAEETDTSVAVLHHVAK